MKHRIKLRNFLRKPLLKKGDTLASYPYIVTEVKFEWQWGDWVYSTKEGFRIEDTLERKARKLQK